MGDGAPDVLHAVSTTPGRSRALHRDVNLSSSEDMVGMKLVPKDQTEHSLQDGKSHSCNTVVKGPPFLRPLSFHYSNYDIHKWGGPEDDHVAWLVLTGNCNAAI